MPISESPVTYQTSDGKSFTDKQDAERHEKLVVATREWEQARTRFGTALAQTQRTADGRLFDWTRWTYYYVAPPHSGWGGGPYLREVSFYVWNCSFDLDKEEMEILYSKDCEKRPVAYRISELYANKDAAERALLTERETWLAEQAEDLAKMRARLGMDEGR